MGTEANLEGAAVQVAEAHQVPAARPAGQSTSTSGLEAFRWTSGGMGLGDLAGGDFISQGSAVSADGSVIVGFTTGTSGRQAFRWTTESGIVGLGDLPGGVFSSEATAVSAEGSRVAGSASGMRRTDCANSTRCSLGSGSGST